MFRMVFPPLELVPTANRLVPGHMKDLKIKKKSSFKESNTDVAAPQPDRLFGNDETPNWAMSRLENETPNYEQARSNNDKPKREFTGSKESEHARP